MYKYWFDGLVRFGKGSEFDNNVVFKYNLDTDNVMKKINFGIKSENE